MALYTAQLQQAPAGLPALPIQYADFAAWQRQWLQGEIFEALLDYWQEQLHDAPSVLELPTDYPRPATQSFRGGSEFFQLSPELSEALKQLSQQQNVTLFMMLLAAFKVLLYRYTGQSDLLVGSPVANRNCTEVEGLVGFFTNTLVLRTDLSANPRFQDLLGQVRRVCLQAYRHQDLPFEQLVEALPVARNLSHHPLFQVMFALRNPPQETLQLPGLQASGERTINPSAKFDLTLLFEATESGLKGGFEYNTALFKPESIRRAIGHLQTLLAAIAAHPQQWIAELPLLTPVEQQQQLAWNSTRVEYAQTACIHAQFEAQVARTPDAIALTFQDQQLTYSELNARANQLAHYLQTLGVKPERLVGISVERSLEMVVGLLGILKAGGAYVPLDPDYPQQRLGYMLADAQAPVLLTQQQLISRLPEHDAQVVCLDADWEKIATHLRNNPASDVTLDNLAYVIYTSGSTGKPKGVANAHRGVSNRLLWMQAAYGLTPEDRVLQKTPFSFDVSVWEFFWTLSTGAQLVLAQPGGHKDSEYLVKLIAEQQITTLHFVPSMLQAFLSEPGLEACGRLRRVICSGEKLSARLQQQFFASGLRTELHNLYGPTEAAIDVTYWLCQPDRQLAEVPIGRPIANVQIFLLDSHLQPVPVGIAGELYIGGVGLARGYWQRPELTAENFIPNPFSQQPGERLYKTGDLASYRPDGAIMFLGRQDNRVKLRGFRIELGEIESVLTQHPDVHAAVVVVQNNQQLVGYAVPKSKSGLTVEKLQAFLQERLPEYMLPAICVILDALPLTPNGKVDRRQLPAPAPLQVGNTAQAARTPVEELLCNIWSQILEVARVGIDDDFFALGGHSLLATQVVSRIRALFQIELPLRSLFEARTVAQLARYIEQMRQVEVAAIAPTRRDRALPLSFAQERLWLLDQMQPGNPAYNIPAAVRLLGLLDRAALERSLKAILQRHEALRTNFSLVAGEPMQVISPTATLTLLTTDLRSLPDQQRECQMQAAIAIDIQKQFDLERDLLVRTHLFQLSDTESVLLVVIHHAVADGWSLGVFFRELAALYGALTAGRPSPLSPLPIQYADFAVWQREHLPAEVLPAQLAYWKQKLAGARSPQLPLDYPRPKTPSLRGASHSFELSSELSQALKTLSARSGATLFMTLLAALTILLARSTQQTDITVGTDVANRHRSELEGLIGFFVNILVLRADLSDNPSFQTLLARVRETTVEAYAHQDLSFSQLATQMPQQAPLFQVLLVMQNKPVPEIELTGLKLAPVEVTNGMAKFDVALFVTETERGIAGTWRYQTDLFKASTIERLSNRLEKLLSEIVARLDAPVHSLEMRSQTEAMAKTQQMASKLQKLKQVKPRLVRLEANAVKTRDLSHGQRLPLVVEPAREDFDPIDWVVNNREWLENQLRDRGAILFRGYHLDSVEQFEQFTRAIYPQLFGEYGDLPRAGVSGKVYASTPYPSDRAILFHNESSHLHCWPMKIWFYCVRPAQRGGETPVADCRQAYQLLSPHLRERFEQKRLLYVRNFIEGLDVSWQQFFHTSDKTEVENRCRQQAIDFEWRADGGLKTRQVRRAVAQHPKTKAWVWFNQILLHHVDCLEPSVRDSMLSSLGEENLPRHVYYGDGTPIEPETITAIQAAYEQATVSFPWQAGDCLMLDNMLTVHGRNPYQGDRKIVVAMGEMMHDRDL